MAEVFFVGLPVILIVLATSGGNRGAVTAMLLGQLVAKECLQRGFAVAFDPGQWWSAWCVAYREMRGEPEVSAGLRERAEHLDRALHGTREDVPDRWDKMEGVRNVPFVRHLGERHRMRRADHWTSVARPVTVGSTLACPMRAIMPSLLMGFARGAPWRLMLHRYSARRS
jgi:hypothetical protein